MRFFVQSLLIICFIPILVIFILAGTVKINLLSFNFWQKNLSKNNTYTELSVSLKTLAESKTIKGGGNKDDIKILTNIASPENVKDFVDNNLLNIINYANGKGDTLMAYIPISKLPKSISLKSDALSKDEIPMNVLLSKFNIASSIPISQLARIGKAASYITTLSLALLILIIFLLIFLTAPGSRFFSISIGIFLTGLIFLLFVNAGSSALNSSTKNLVNISELTTRLLSILVTPIFTKILQVWTYVCLIFMFIGIGLLFAKKHEIA